MRPLGQRSTLWAALAAGPNDRDPVALGLGLVTLGVIVATDLLSGSDLALTSSYALPPLIAAYAAGLWGVLAICVLSVATAVATPLWNDGATLEVVRIAIVLASCGIAILTAWLGVRARASEMRMRLLDSLGRIGDGTMPLGNALSRTVDSLVPGACDFCMIDVFRAGKATRVAARAMGGSEASEIEEWLMKREPALPEAMLEADRTSIPRPTLHAPFDRTEMERVSHGDDSERNRLEALNVRSTIHVPLVARGRALGVLTLGTAWSGRRYRAEDVRFAQIIATRVALVLDNAGLFSDLESVEARLDAVMRSLGEAVLVVDGDGVVVYANPAAAGWLGFADVEELIAAGESGVERRFLFFDEDANELHEPLKALAAPSRIGGETLLRVVNAESREERWARISVEPVRGTDDDPVYAVMAVEDLTEVKEAELSQRLLARVGELLVEAGDGDLLQSIAEAAVPDFADWCAIGVPEGGVLENRALAATPELLESARDLVTNHQTPVTTGLVARVLSSGEAVSLNLDRTSLGERAYDPGHRDAMEASGVRSVIVAPIISGSKATGVMTFINSPSSRVYDDADRSIAADIARRVGTALENARLSGEIEKVALTLQSELLPPELPTIPGWSLDAIYEPAGEVSYVGGDFYDVFETDRSWVLVIGDVVGRGAAAASLTAVARSTLRSAALSMGSGSEILAALDRVLKDRPRPGICSAVIVSLTASDSATGPLRCELTVAGHPPPLLIRRDGRVEEAGGLGSLLGALPEPGWTTVPIEIGEGEQLLLYTDGVTEAKREQGDRFGEDRLQRELAGLTAPRAPIERVIRALDEFGAEPGADDIALVSIARGTPPGTRHGDNEKRPKSRIRGLRTGGDAEPSDSLTRAAGDLNVPQGFEA